MDSLKSSAFHEQSNQNRSGLISSYAPPAILAQPEPVIQCYLGGLVTIKVGVSGFNIFFNWEQILGDNVVFIGKTNEPHLILGPINQHHLNSQYRMIAIDQYGQFVVTQTTRLELKQSEQTHHESITRTFQSDHIPRQHRNPFTGMLDRPSNREFEKTLSAYNSANNIPPPEIDFGDILKRCERRHEELDSFIVAANQKLKRLNSKENFIDISYSPRYTVQPQDQKVQIGGSIKVESLAIYVNTYRWYHDGNRLDCMDSTLWIWNVGFEDAGLYSVVATNKHGFTESEVIRVTVHLPSA